MTAPDSAPLDDDRHETPTERMDRNWNELLQELRVTQTGVQILTGFLLTVPFQQRFGDLDAYQRNLYLELVVLAIVTTGLIVAPVSLHRILFRKRLKRQLVTAADRLARAGLGTLTLVLAGTTMLLFDVVVGRTEGVIAGVVVLVALVVLWVLLPLRLVHVAEARAARAARHDDPREGPPHDASR
ncbi:DUF6328 family protein [Cellulomonas sp. P22]|uniref:DUF6328 family protein n=1 Tax=Cellulomonas sp. P22 TaxID=3373189 RepID=UPI0037BD9B6F